MDLASCAREFERNKEYLFPSSLPQRSPPVFLSYYSRNIISFLICTMLFELVALLRVLSAYSSHYKKSERYSLV